MIHVHPVKSIQNKPLSWCYKVAKRVRIYYYMCAENVYFIVLILN